MANYLVLGSGGREHALAWKLATDSSATTPHHVVVAPGNAGIAADPLIAGCVPLDPLHFDAVIDYVRSHDIDLTIVGPEAPLEAGITDAFQAANLPIFAPSKEAARLETSKIFAKEILDLAGVPQASHRSFTSLSEAVAFLSTHPLPVVIKADGPAAGKGVFICHSHDDAIAAATDILDNKRFGDAGSRILVESFLSGREVSFLAITDGENIFPLTTSQDHKRLLDQDQGPNTGGMGVIVPSPIQTSTPGFQQRVIQEVLVPVLSTLRQRGITYQGFIYAGLMVDNDNLYVLEFNARMGDPETQPILFTMQHDLAPLLFATLDGSLASFTPPSSSTGSSACCVVVASNGYPASSDTGYPIQGLDHLDLHNPDVKIFFAGVGTNPDGQLINTGGRVLGVTARGDSPEAARKLAYHCVSLLSWEGCHYRHDIGAS